MITKKDIAFVISIIVFLFCMLVFYNRDSLFSTQEGDAKKEKEYQEDLRIAQVRRDSFNKNVLPYIEFNGIIESRGYTRDNGDHNWINVRPIKPIKIGNIPKEYKYIYDFSNDKLIKIFYANELDDSNIGDTIIKKWKEDFFRFQYKSPSPHPLQKMYYTKEMFLK